MNHHYSDIRARIEEEPTWWDEYAVPRYGPFTPDDGADIYAREIALVLIRCQNCGAPFKVAFSWNAYRLNYERVEGVDYEGQPLFRMAPALSLSERIPEGRIHYGDPPNAGCCAAGPTMNCEDERVLEFWRRLLSEMSLSDMSAVVIVAHKTLGRILLSHLRGDPTSQYREHEMETGSIAEVHVGQDGCVHIVVENDTAHLSRGI